MRKFFCYYNDLTEKQELRLQKSPFTSSKILSSNQSTMLSEIQAILQQIYNDLITIKEKITDENILKKIDERELLLSNLYYSLFSSPLELVSPSQENITAKDLAIRLIDNAIRLVEKIDIPEYNRLATLLKNNFDSIHNNIKP